MSLVLTNATFADSKILEISTTINPKPHEVPKSTTRTRTSSRKGSLAIQDAERISFFPFQN